MLPDLGCGLHAGVCLQVDSLLERSSAPSAGEEPGPDTELEHWRQQMSRFNSLTEQLKTHECRLVLGVTSMTHSQVRSSSWVLDACVAAAQLYSARDWKNCKAVEASLLQACLLLMVVCSLPPPTGQQALEGTGAAVDRCGQRGQRQRAVPCHPGPAV